MSPFVTVAMETWRMCDHSQGRGKGLGLGVPLCNRWGKLLVGLNSEVWLHYYCSCVVTLVDSQPKSCYLFSRDAFLAEFYKDETRLRL